MGKVSFTQVKELLSGVQSYGNYIAAICPFHEDTRPSLMVYRDGWFRCVAGGCGVSGNLDKLHRKLLGWDASTVVKEATAFVGPHLPTTIEELEVVILEAHNALLKFDQFQWYIKNRGVEGRIEPCRLGWYNGWYTIPIFDDHHALHGAMLRANSAIQEATGQRFRHPEGQKNMMYCPDWYLYKNSKRLAIVFGMFDALAVSDLRFPVVTPTSGDQSFNPEWLDDCRKEIIIFPDEGGYSDAMKLAGKLGWRAKVVKLDYPEGVKDPCGYLETGRRDELHNVLASHLGEN